MSRDLVFQREMARRHQREAQQGLGSPIISTNLARIFHAFLWSRFRAVFFDFFARSGLVCGVLDLSR
jgi:hypothetical protein